MTDQMPEADWKVFRELHRVALLRYCDTVVEVTARLAADKNTNSHDRYLLILEHIRESKEEMSFLFDDFRRSTAFLHLVAIANHQLITEDELARFSPETRDGVRSLMEFAQGKRKRAR